MEGVKRGGLALYGRELLHGRRWSVAPALLLGVTIQDQLFGFFHAEGGMEHLLVGREASGDDHEDR